MFSYFYLELPWDQPSVQCQEFINWKDNDRWSTQTPWSKLDTLAISLLRKVLSTNPTYRLSLEKILDHKWCNMQFIDNGEFIFFIFFFNFYIIIKSTEKVNNFWNSKKEILNRFFVLLKNSFLLFLWNCLFGKKISSFAISRIRWNLVVIHNVTVTNSERFFCFFFLRRWKNLRKILLLCNSCVRL